MSICCEAHIPAFARDILQTLEGAGHEAYCVGGCVRDSLLGRTPGDWDITTSARPEETLALFGADALPTGLRHGTVTVRRPDGSAEVTTFRRDGDYTDHRHPESVAFTDSLTEDLARRDFTVNAMALSLRAERAAGLDEVLRRLDAILREDACFSLRQLAVNGRDLLALGLRGAEIGRALDLLLNEVVEGRLPNEQEALLAAVRGRDT